MSSKDKDKTYKRNMLHFGCWNAMNLHESKGSLERKTALIAKVMSSYNIDIANLTENRFVDISELEAGAWLYILFLTE